MTRVTKYALDQGASSTMDSQGIDPRTSTLSTWRSPIELAVRVAPGEKGEEPWRVCHKLMKSNGKFVTSRLSGIRTQDLRRVKPTH